MGAIFPSEMRRPIAAVYFAWCGAVLVGFGVPRVTSGCDALPNSLHASIVHRRLRNIIGAPMRHRLRPNIGAAIMFAMQWKNIISDLKASGLTQMQIAEKCGCAQSTISEMATDGNRIPSFPIGAALLDLHKKHLKKRKSAQVAA